MISPPSKPEQFPTCAPIGGAVGDTLAVLISSPSKPEQITTPTPRQHHAHHPKTTPKKCI